MRFTAGDLRGAVADPAALARRLRAIAAGPPASAPRSPQRSWIEASIRRYYKAHRNPDSLIRDYRGRTLDKGRTASKRSEIANGETMLQLFLTWEEAEPSPRISMHPRTDQQVAGHIISMGHDLVYERPDGYLIREVWTDSVVRRPEHRQLMCAASLLHAEQVFGRGRVQAIEIWQLRVGLQERLTRREALRLRPALRALLDRIELSVQT